MPQRQIHVLVVDDSPLMRELICDQLALTKDIVVTGTASNGPDALAKAQTLRPDVITLDVQMPGMNGLETLDAILAWRSQPVLMVSAITQRAADITLDALERGAADYLAKPAAANDVRQTLAVTLPTKIRAIAHMDVRQLLKIRRSRHRLTGSPLHASPNTVSSDTIQTHDYQAACIALGISTGGPPALAKILAELKPPMPPIVIVQHMPAMFTGPFAQRLDAVSPLSVQQASTGDRLQLNHVFVAPGGNQLRLRQHGRDVVVKIDSGPPVSGHSPSVDGHDGFGCQPLWSQLPGRHHDRNGPRWSRRLRCDSPSWRIRPRARQRELRRVRHESGRHGRRQRRPAILTPRRGARHHDHHSPTPPTDTPWSQHGCA